MFRVGQKVVCVDDEDRACVGGCGWERPITAGTIYTIRWVGEHPYKPWRNQGQQVRLVGLIRAPNPCGAWPDMPFRADRFRPLTEKKADMEARNELFRKWETHKEKRVTAPQDEQA
jgi:hypothetical protein